MNSVLIVGSVSSCTFGVSKRFLVLYDYYEMYHNNNFLHSGPSFYYVSIKS